MDRVLTLIAILGAMTFGLATPTTSQANSVSNNPPTTTHTSQSIEITKSQEKPSASTPDLEDSTGRNEKSRRDDQLTPGADTPTILPDEGTSATTPREIEPETATPTETGAAATETPTSPTSTAETFTPTPVSPTATPLPPTATPVPPTATPTPELPKLPAPAAKPRYCSGGWTITGYYLPEQSDFENYDDFISDVIMQGSGKLDDGKYLNYLGETIDQPLTASGVAVQDGVVAFDPNYFPFNTTFWVDGKPYIGADTGGAILGRHLDIFTGVGKDAQQKAFDLTRFNQTICWTTP